MAEMLLIGAVAVLTFVIVLVALLLWRPPKGDDGDRFTNARRITTGWAADADLDPAAPATLGPLPGVPAERGGDSWVRVVEEIPAVPRPGGPQAVPEEAVPEAAVPEPRAAEPAPPAQDPAPTAPPTPRRTGGRTTRA